MFKKALMASSLIILILMITLAAVSAEDNTTAMEISEDAEIDECPQILKNTATSEGAKKDADFEIEFDDEFTPRWDKPEGPYLFIYPKSENMTGNFTVYVDSKNTYSGDVNDFQDPNVEINAPYYKLGNHTILVRYSGDNTYNALDKTHIFCIETVKIYMPSEEYVMGDDVISLDLPANAKGTATVYINADKAKTISVKATDDTEWYSNYVSFSLDEYLKFNETYNITVEFRGKYSGKTLTASKSAKITSITYPLNIFTYPENEYGLENLALLYTPKDIKKDNLNVSIDGKSVDFAKYTGDEFLEEYTYFVNISSCKIGKHNITVKYAGDEKYPPKKANDTFTVYGEIKIPTDDLTYGKSADITLKLPDDATGNLTVRISREQESYEFYKSVEIRNGTADIRFNCDNVGIYYINVTYDGNYNIENVAGTYLEVIPLINIPNKMTWGEEKFITIKVNPQDNGTLSFYRYGKLFKKVEVINASASISLADLPFGEYYEGETYITYKNANYEYENPWYNIYVKAKTQLSGPASMYYGESKSFSFKLYGANGKTLSKGKTVTFKIGKYTFKVKTDKNGIATLKVPNTITAGKYTVRASYADYSASAKLTVNQILTLNSAKVKKSAKKLVLTAKLSKKLKGKTVTFKFNGKTYKAKTNSKGIAKVTIKKSQLSKLKVGKNVKYSATYLKQSVKKTAKIKR